MKKIIITILLMLPLGGFAHEGDSHSHEGERQASGVKSYFSTEAVSDKYELFLKYGPIHPGEEAVLRLFLSEYHSNKPVDSAKLKVISREDGKINFVISRIDRGYYEIKATFPEAKKYSLAVTIESPLGPDLLLLQDIESGKELQAEEETQTVVWANPYLIFGTGLLAGLAAMFLLMRARYRKVAAVFMTGLCLLPTANWQNAVAHEGHDDDSQKGNNFSNAFEVPKETQFLFDVFTQPIKPGAFSETTKLFGTIIPASNGQANVQSPQVGRVLSLHAQVGQKVSQGQLLAMIEPTIDAGNLVSILSEKNNVEAELEAARKEYERLKSIEDIAAKRDVAEAEARYQKAKENQKLFQSLESGKSGQARVIALKSPISGIVGNFTFAVGATINANETLFTVTNLSRVFVEAQVFDKDAERVNRGKNFVVECATADTHKTAEVKLLASAQSINPTNQTQRVIFQMENPHGDFKIGEFVNVRVFDAGESREITLPNGAISEINGRPVVFIKDGAEQYSVSYISAGHNNGTYTLINKGVEEGERVVVNGTYQMKMIYLNQ
ncbi:MAG: efflux RND transporter periplasmic adaptor subunit [Bacteroidota bacterium]